MTQTTTTYTATQLEGMKVAELKQIIKDKNYEIHGAWKMKQAQLVSAILELQHTEMTGEKSEIVEQIEQDAQLNREAQAQKTSSTPGRRNSSMVRVTTEDGETKEFFSNKDFAEYYNEKHGTTFRNDILWYLLRGRNKKALATFQITNIEEVNE